jgi:hypothetical protein
MAADRYYFLLPVLFLGVYFGNSYIKNRFSKEYPYVSGGFYVTLLALHHFLYLFIENVKAGAFYLQIWEDSKAGAPTILLLNRMLEALTLGQGAFILFIYLPLFLKKEREHTLPMVYGAPWLVGLLAVALYSVILLLSFVQCGFYFTC